MPYRHESPVKRRVAHWGAVAAGLCRNGIDQFILIDKSTACDTGAEFNVHAAHPGKTPDEAPCVVVNSWSTGIL